MLVTLKFISNPDLFQLQTTTTELITGTTLGTFLFCPTLSVAHHRNCYLHALVVEKKTKSNSLSEVFLSLHICNPLTYQLNLQNISQLTHFSPNSLPDQATTTATPLGNCKPPNQPLCFHSCLPTIYFPYTTSIRPCHSPA